MTHITTTGTILDRIVDQKRFRLDQRQNTIAFEQLRRDAEALTQQPSDFAAALIKPKSLGLIAEIKQASPSKGIIAPDFRPVEQAMAYAAANVQAISVLTEEDFFLGSDEHLRAIHAAVPQPILRKDFTIDAYQIYEARLLGASAILLIVALLSNPQIREFYAQTKSLGLSVLVEVHTMEELMRALDCGVHIIGINNRDLKSFQVDLGTTERLAGVIPQDRIVVAESGIVTPRDMARVYRAGAHAVLVGETLMRASDSATAFDQVGSTILNLYSEMPG
ncbi:MAG: indole-3-glycerol phosphate synthase TrpC [Eubacteriales bacterium]|nr:indole-3-glycerol phosphate synthase TrpC [Eubacteriales bacterium]